MRVLHSGCNSKVKISFLGFFTVIHNSGRSRMLDNKAPCLRAWYVVLKRWRGSSSVGIQATISRAAKCETGITDIPQPRT